MWRPLKQEFGIFQLQATGNNGTTTGTVVKERAAAHFNFLQMFLFGKNIFELITFFY